MNNQSTVRVAMLAVSGCLLSGTVLGWVDYANKQARLRAEQSKVATMRTVPVPATAAAPVVQPSAEPVTPQQVAAAAAAREAGRADPMAPVAVTNYSRNADIVPAPPGSSQTAWPPQTALQPPPQAVPVDPAQEYRNAIAQLPLTEAVRLVGLMDGKAFFAMPRDIAREKNLPYAFSIGPGEQFADLKMEAMTEHSVTLRYNNKICVKELGAIR